MTDDLSLEHSCKNKLLTVHVKKADEEGYYKLTKFMFCLKCNKMVQLALTQKDIE